jgi:TatA/E family protein of Tat protein translocase
MGIESPVHLLFIAVVALIVLGPKRLPDLARSLGQGLREFRGSLEEGARAPAPPEPDVHAEPPPVVGAPVASEPPVQPPPPPPAPHAAGEEDLTPPDSPPVE